MGSMYQCTLADEWILAVGSVTLGKLPHRFVLDVVDSHRIPPQLKGSFEMSTPFFFLQLSPPDTVFFNRTFSLGRFKLDS